MSAAPNDSYDIVIVGGGVTGGSSACFIASDPNFTGTIAVVERDLSYENSPSAKATGGVRQQFSTPENVQMGLFGAHFVKHIDEYLSVDGEVPDLGFREEGYLLLASEDSLALMTSNNEVQRAYGAQTVMQTPTELAARFPWLDAGTVAGGCLGIRNEGWLDPYGLTQAYRKKARSMEVNYLQDEVVGLQHNGSRVTGVTLRDGGKVQAGTLINAAGASGLVRVAEMVGLALPIESRKRCTFVFSCRESIGVTPLTILPEGCAFRPEGANYIANLAPVAERDLPTHDVEIDHDQFEERIWPILAARVPAFEAIKTIGAYCCHYDVNTLDENLIIDRHPELENFYFAGGFSGHGLQQSPATGRAMSELVVHGGFRSLDLSRFGYERVVSGVGVHEANCF